MLGITGTEVEQAQMASPLNIIEAVVPRLSQADQSDARRECFREAELLNVPSFRPELQLILACARTEINDEAATQISQLLQTNLNWKYLLRKARQQGVTPLIQRTLSDGFRDAVPDHVFQQLQDVALFNAQYNLLRTLEMLKILRLLELKRIGALPFKGPVLAEVAYGNLGLREFGDLDILIHKRDLKAAKDLLLCQGYRLGVPLTWVQKRLPRLSKRKDMIFVKDEGRIIVELHWRLTGNFFPLPFNMKRLWKHLVPVPIAGVVVNGLPPEELLLYLCTHGGRHSWMRLAWICDVAELIRIHPGLDWDGLLDRGRALGCERMLALGLLLASELLGASLPANVSTRIQSDPKVHLAAMRVRELLHQREDIVLGISYLYHHHLLVRERLRDRMRIYLHYFQRYVHLAVTPNERDHELVPLPGHLWFFYYMLRPIRLVREYGRSEFRTLMGRFRQERS